MVNRMIKAHTAIKTINMMTAAFDDAVKENPCARRLPQHERNNWLTTKDQLSEAVNFDLPADVWTAPYGEVARDFGAELHRHGLLVLPHDTIWLLKHLGPKDERDPEPNLAYLLHRVESRDALPKVSVNPDLQRSFESNLDSPATVCLEYSTFLIDLNRVWASPYCYGLMVMWPADHNGELDIMVGSSRVRPFRTEPALEERRQRVYGAAATPVMEDDIDRDADLHKVIMGSVVEAVHTLCGLLACKGVKTVMKEPSKLMNKARKDKGKPTENATCAVTIPADGMRQPSHEAVVEGQRRSPIPHHRRGHVRTYHRGEEGEFARAFPPTIVMASKELKLALKAKDYILRR